MSLIPTAESLGQLANSIGIDTTRLVTARDKALPPLCSLFRVLVKLLIVVVLAIAAQYLYLYFRRMLYGTNVGTYDEAMVFLPNS